MSNVEEPFKKCSMTKNMVTGQINHDQLSLRRTQKFSNRSCNKDQCNASITNNTPLNDDMNSYSMLLQAKDFFDEYFKTMERYFLLLISN